MPFVRIYVRQGASQEQKQQISDSVHRALVDTFNVPTDDRFQVISEHGTDELVCTPAYLGIAHANNVVFVQITCSEGRTVEMKKSLYRRMVELISDGGSIAAADVIINLVEIKKENWSFGEGIAHYA